MRKIRLTRVIIAALGLLVLGGCAGTDLHRLKDPATGQQLTDSFQGTTDPVTKLRVLATPATLVSVKTASLAGFDRIGFTFSGKKVPAYQLIYPQGQGNAASKPANFEIRLGARANLPNGKPGVAQKSMALNYSSIQTLTQTRDGEEYVFWTAALSKKVNYRVTELSNPPRIILDFKH